MVNDDDCDSDRIPQQFLGGVFWCCSALFLIFSAPCLNRTTLFFKCSAYFVNCAALCFFELFSPTFELCSPTFEFQSCIVDEYDSSDVITFSRGAFPTISPRSFAHGCLCSPVHQERVEVTGQSLEPSKLSLLSSLSLSLQSTEYEKYRRQHSIATCVLGFDVSNLV